jgi:uncharacterized phage-associated protein
LKPVPVETVAEYFLSLTEPDAGDYMSNLKLQKLLYYAQGFHLAVFGQPFFEEPILSWHQGPVVEKIYHKYEHKDGVLAMPEHLHMEQLHDIQIGLLNNVYTSFAQFSAWKLRLMTFHEPPYQQTLPGREITRELLTTYFKTQLVEEEA